MARRHRAIFAVASAVIALALAGCGSGGDENEIKIGALLDESAGWTTLGKASAATLPQAVDAANERLEKNGSDLRVKLFPEDVAGDPDTALEKIKQLHEDGVRIVIGPQSSSEVEAVRDYADENGMVVISQGSTAHSLSEPGDNVYRFVPDDRREVQALMALLERDQVDTIVPIWRDDTGNSDLHEALEEAFDAAGGTTEKGVMYSQDEKDFEVPVEDLRRQVEDARSGGGKVAVYLAAFDEVVQLFDQARKDSVLRSVEWYGSDGVAQNQPLLKNVNAAEFAVETVYPNPTLGIDPRIYDRSAKVRAEVDEETGSEPDAFALSGYDALQVAADAYEEAGGTDDLDAYKQDLVTTANDYQGMTGSTRLNRNGDRSYGSFDFWQVCPKGEDTFVWTTTLKYIASSATSGRLIDGSPCS